ncbi:MAG TPA: flagellar motor protein [Symbiobacteriaceae bacterium]
MDLATIGGFVIAIGLIAGGAAMEHVAFGSLWGTSAFMIITGGSIGATIFSHTMSELKQVPGAVKMTIMPPKLDYPGMIDYLVGLSERARRNGLLSLQDEAEKAPNPLAQRGLTMAVDGSNPEAVQEALEAMSDIDNEEALHAAAVFDTCGGYAPTIGILGTVMGLIMVMGDLSTPEALGPKIATAFLATLYGVGFANLFFLPMGAKIKGLVKEQAKFNEMIIEAITGLQSGESPRRLREKLTVYMGTHKPGKAKGAKEAKEAKAGAPAQEGT